MSGELVSITEIEIRGRTRKLLGHGSIPVVFPSQGQAEARRDHYRGFGTVFEVVPTGGSGFWLEVVE